jgi:hypothetical protein
LEEALSESQVITVSGRAIGSKPLLDVFRDLELSPAFWLEARFGSRGAIERGVLSECKGGKEAK